ncbi:MAG: hypothetical protein JKY20_08080 [Alphaproteobacteria bacterium]|nr:hypothetical protein [Alphaproteobacteria bacterium]
MLIEAGTPVERPTEVPEKFWDSQSAEIRVDALLHSYQALEKKLSERSGVEDGGGQSEFDHDPETAIAGTVELDDPGGIDLVPEPEPLPDYVISLDHDLFETDPRLNDRLRAAGFSEDQAQLVYDLAGEELMPIAEEIASALQGEVDDRRLEAHFGGPDTWRETQRQLKAWGAANLPEEAFESLASTYEGVQALHRLMQGAEPRIVRSVNTGGSVSAGALRRMIRDPRYWRDRDPAFIREVTAGFETMYPEKP